MAVTSTHALCWTNLWALIRDGEKISKAIKNEMLITQVNKQPHAGQVGEETTINHHTGHARKGQSTSP